MPQAKFTGQLYQLTSSRKLDVGAYVAVKGPWDTYGVVQSFEQKADGSYLNLIRGVHPKQGEKTVASF